MPMYRSFRPLFTYSTLLPWLKRLGAVAPCFVVLVTLLAIRAVIGRYGWHWPVQLTYAFGIPPAFMLWLKTWDDDDFRPAQVSVWHEVVFYPVLMLSALVIAYPPWTPYRAFATFVALASAIILHMGVVPLIRGILKRPGAFILAMLLGSILYIHAYLHEQFWASLCEATANVMLAVARTAGFHVSISTTPENFIRFYSSIYSLRLEPPCSGMDGMAIFFGLLTTVFLMDWKMFRHLPLLRLYIAGFGLMFLVNALRILVLFCVGSIGAHPKAPEWLKPLNDVMFTMFHEHVGWTIYVATFAVFVAPLYRMAYAQQHQATD